MTSPYLDAPVRDLVTATVEASEDKPRTLLLLAQSIIESYHSQLPTSTGAAWLKAVERELK